MDKLHIFAQNHYNKNWTPLGGGGIEGAYPLMQLMYALMVLWYYVEWFDELDTKRFTSFQTV